MKIPLAILLLLASLSQKAKGQNGFDIVYDFCTDTPVSSTIYSCYADSNRFFVHGGTATIGISNLHGTLASFDYTGNLLWYKKILSPGKYNTSASSSSILKIDSDKYVMYGIVEDYQIDTPKAVWHPYLHFFNGTGDSIRQHVFTDPKKIRYFTGMLYHDNHLVTVGLKETVPARTLWICKYDTVGNLIWEREYLRNNLTTVDEAKIVLAADRKHYVIAGKMLDTTRNALSSCFVKVDTAGNLIWFKSLRKQYQSPQNRVDVVANPSGGYYFVSTYLKLPMTQPYSAHIYYGKLDEGGDTIWTRTFQDIFLNCEGYRIQFSPDNRHLVLLTGPSSGTKAGAMKIDTLGNVIWARLYKHVFPNNPQKNGGILQSLSVTPDNRYLMAGAANEGNGNLSWMILTDSNGCRYANDSACMPVSVEKAALPDNVIQVYPNPFFERVFIDNVRLGMEVRIFDRIGKEVFKYRCQNHREELSLNHLSPGPYLIRIHDALGNAVCRKVLKN